MVAWPMLAWTESALVFPGYRNVVFTAHHIKHQATTYRVQHASYREGRATCVHSELVPAGSSPESATVTFLLGLPSWLPSASTFLTTSMPSMTLPNTWSRGASPLSFSAMHLMLTPYRRCKCQGALGDPADGSQHAWNRKMPTTWRPSSQLVTTVVMKNWLRAHDSDGISAHQFDRLKPYGLWPFTCSCAVPAFGSVLTCHWCPFRCWPCSGSPAFCASR